MKPMNNMNSATATTPPTPYWNYQRVCTTIETGAAAGTAVYANRTWESQKRQEKVQVMEFTESTRKMVEQGTMHADRAKEMLEELGVNPQYIDGQSFHMMASPGQAAIEYITFLSKKGLLKLKSSGSGKPTSSLSSRFFSVREPGSTSDYLNRQECFVVVESNPIPPRQGRHPCSFPDSFVGNSLAAIVGIFLLFGFKYIVRKIVKLFCSAKQPERKATGR